MKKCVKCKSDKVYIWALNSPHPYTTCDECGFIDHKHASGITNLQGITKYKYSSEPSPFVKSLMTATFKVKQ